MFEIGGLLQLSDAGRMHAQTRCTLEDLPMNGKFAHALLDESTYPVTYQGYDGTYYNYKTNNGSEWHLRHTKYFELQQSEVQQQDFMNMLP